MGDIKKFVRVTLYDSELYHFKQPHIKNITINTAGLTDEEINEQIHDIREIQKEKNIKFKKQLKDEKTKKIASKLNEIGPQNINSSLSTTELDNQALFKPIFDDDTGNTFCLFGSSKSGKSTLMMKIYNEYIPAFMPKKKLLTTLFAMNSQIRAYDNDEVDKLGNPLIMKCPFFNTASGQYIDWMRKVNIQNGNVFNFLIMIDDFINVRFSSVINNMVLTYRNSNISSIICLQYVNLLAKSARANVNGVFLLHMNTDEAIRGVVEVYLKSILRKFKILGIDDCINWYKEYTSNYGFVYVNPLHGKIYISKVGKWFDC